MVSPKACCRAGNRNESHLKEYVKGWFIWHGLATIGSWYQQPFEKKKPCGQAFSFSWGSTVCTVALCLFFFPFNWGHIAHGSKGELYFHNYWVMVINHQSISQGYIYIYMNEWLPPQLGGTYKYQPFCVGHVSHVMRPKPRFWKVSLFLVVYTCSAKCIPAGIY